MGNQEGSANIMKKFFAILLLMIFVLSSISALAEKINFTFAVVPTSSAYEYQVGARGMKSDNEQNFYVTTTSNGFSDGRTIYYIACNSTGTLVGGIVANTGSAAYSSTAYANQYYMLAYRAGRLGTDSSTLCCLVSGRWNP